MAMTPRQYEKNLAAAYARIEKLVAAERDLSLAENYAREAENYAREAEATVNNRRQDLRALRVHTAKWLEEQR